MQQLNTQIFYPPPLPTHTQDVNWTYIRRSEDVLDVFWTSYVRSIYVLCLRGIEAREKSLTQQSAQLQGPNTAHKTY